MRYFNRKVFDKSVAVAAASGAAVQYSDLAFNALLGSCETIALHTHATAENGAPTVTVATEGSNDGQEWLVITASTTVLSAMAVGSSQASIVNDAATPRMAFIRYKVSVSAGQAKIRLIACGRGAQ